MRKVFVANNINISNVRFNRKRSDGAIVTKLQSLHRQACQNRCAASLLQSQEQLRKRSTLGSLINQS